MGEIEKKIKEIIIKKYGSMKNFSDKIDMPYTTMDSIFKRGFKKSGAKNLVKITSALEIDVVDLLNGHIEPLKSNSNFADSLEWQELRAEKEKASQSSKDCMITLLNELKKIIISNDSNDIFTGIPEEDLLYYFWSFDDETKHDVIELISDISSNSKEINKDDLNKRIEALRKHYYKKQREILFDIARENAPTDAELKKMYQSAVIGLMDDMNKNGQLEIVKHAKYIHSQNEYLEKSDEGAGKKENE